MIIFKFTQFLNERNLIIIKELTTKQAYQRATHI